MSGGLSRSYVLLSLLPLLLEPVDHATLPLRIFPRLGLLDTGQLLQVLSDLTVDYL